MGLGARNGRSSHGRAKRQEDGVAAYRQEAPMNAIKFWKDVWHSPHCARPIAWCIAAVAVAALACQINGVID